MGKGIGDLAPVVRKVENAVQGIGINKTNCVYPQDSDLFGG